MAKTKIVVLQMKEIIYTAIFAGLAILLIIVLIVMFSGNKKSNDKSKATYKSGVYTSEIKLGESSLNLEVVVDDNQIKSVDLVNLEESVTTMFPLIKPSLTSLEKQLVKGKSPDQISVSGDGQYTSTLLLEGIQKALETAKE